MGKKLRISRRLVQEMLAGKVSAEEFSRLHGWGSGPEQIENPFQKALGEGRLLSAVMVVGCPEDDDDWLEFSFSSDAAVTPFK